MDGERSDEGILLWATWLSATYARLIDDASESEALEGFFRSARGIPFTASEHWWFASRRTALFRRQSAVDDLLVAFRCGVDRELIVSMLRQVDAIYRREFTTYKLMSAERSLSLQIVCDSTWTPMPGQGKD